MTWTYDMEHLPGEREEVLVVAKVGNDGERACVMLAWLDWRDVAEGERTLTWRSTAFDGTWLAPALQVYGWAHYEGPLLPAELDTAPEAPEPDEGHF